MDIIANIREARMARRVSQAALAEAIGMSTEGYNRFERRGGNKVTVEQLAKIADALKMAIPELLGYNLEAEIQRKDTGTPSEGYLDKYNRMIDHAHLCFELFDKWLQNNKKTCFKYLSLQDEESDKEEELQSIIEALNEPELRMIFFGLLGFSKPALVTREDEIVGRLTPYTNDEKMLLRDYMRDRFNL